MTLLLSHADVTAAVPLGEALDLLARGFRATGGRPPRVSADLLGPGTAHPSPGLLPGVPAYTVGAETTLPGRSPAPRRVVYLHDLDSGEPLAVLDAASTAAWRTGLAAALATHTLAAPEARTLGFVGTGARARAALAGLRHLRRWDRVVVTDRDRRRAAALPATVLPNPASVVAEADAVVLATTACSPLLYPADVRPGQHLTSLGVDGPGKRELSPALLTCARLIVDDVDAAMARGALGGAGLNAGHCDGTLGQVLRGEVAASATGGRPSVYAAAGPPWQDLAVSWVVYQHALAAGVGTRIESVPHPSHRPPRPSPASTRRPSAP